MVWNKGLTKETDKRVRKNAISIKNGYKNGRIPWNIGKRMPEEVKRKISESEKGKIVSNKTRKKISKIQKGRKLTPEWRENIKKSAPRGKNHPNYGKKFNNVWNKGLTKKTDRRMRRISKKAKKRWRDIEFTKRIIKSINRKPNKLEKKLKNLIIKNNLPYIYVGNYKFWIDGKNPDFLHSGGKNKVIELFGDYWHNLDGHPSPDKRIRDFKRCGYKCLVIWENELRRDQISIVERIKEFDING